MNKSTKHSIKIGFFIIIGLVLFILIIYYVGSKQNLFSSTTNVYAIFKNVDGLREGNTVRFAGIDVGVVKSIEIIGDSSVKVSMIIGDKAQQFIKVNSQATVGSEGLIGNKLVSISPGSPQAPSIDDGDILPVAEPVTVDQAISMLLESGENARDITQDLEEITSMIKEGKGLLGSLVADPTLTNQFKGIINQLQASSRNFKQVTDDFSTMANNIQQGEGTLGRLIASDDIAVKINNVLDSLQIASHHALETTRSLSAFSEKLNDNEGILGQLTSDAELSEEIYNLLVNFNQAAQEIDATAQKINNSWLLNLFGGRTNEASNKGEN